MRMAAQGLGARGAEDVAAAVTGCAGIQAQDLLSSRLAVRARTGHEAEAQVARACDQERSVVRTWLMRGTLHMVAAADVRWLVRLLGPTIAARFQHRRAQLGLDPALCERLLQKLPGVLAGRSLSRREVVADLAQAGVRLDPGGQAAAHAMVFAAAAGVICRGPDREVEGEPTYVLLKEWLARAEERRPVEPEVELARSYFAGFGPAAVEYFAAWSGFGLPAARAACSPLGLVTVDATAAGFSWRESMRRVQAGGFCLSLTPTWSATGTALCCAMPPPRKRSTPAAGSIPPSSMTGAWLGAGGCAASSGRAPSPSGCSSPLGRREMRRLWQQRLVTSAGFWASRLDWSCGEARH